MLSAAEWVVLHFVNLQVKLQAAYISLISLLCVHVANWGQVKSLSIPREYSVKFPNVPF